MTLNKQIDNAITVRCRKVYPCEISKKEYLEDFAIKTISDDNIIVKMSSCYMLYDNIDVLIFDLENIRNIAKDGCYIAMSRKYKDIIELIKVE